ncbi:MAG: diguanylate cyclase, partial [Acidimicrobiales bacterium]
VIGRLGGDEFAALVLSTDLGDREEIPRRLQHAVAASNSSRPVFPLSLSIGSVEFDPRKPVPILALLEQADRAMYGKKAGGMRRLDQGMNYGRAIDPLLEQELLIGAHS